MSIRTSQILLLSLLALYTFMVFINNILDPQANLIFVEMILSMEDVFPDSPQAWRGIEHPILQRVAFGLIIGTEFFTSVCCSYGVYHMICARKMSEEKFTLAKKWGVLGIMLGIVLWFGGFVIVGGEWFLSWQSEHFSGVELGLRNAIFFLGVLIVMGFRESDYKK